MNPGRARADTSMRIDSRCPGPGANQVLALFSTVAETALRGEKGPALSGIALGHRQGACRSSALATSSCGGFI